AVVCAPGTPDTAAELATFGADRVLVLKHAAFERYAPEAMARALADHTRSGGYETVLVGASALGRDLAPRLAARLGVPLVADVTAVSVESGSITAVRPVYAGKALLQVRANAKPVVVSLRPNAFTPIEQPRNAAMQVVEANLPDGPGRVIARETKAVAAGVLDVAEASVVISGGRGLKEPANFKL